jgi:L-threonylcarbamoyladenylate synthase
MTATVLSLSPDSVTTCVLVCADALAKGRVIAYPTESSYALGADATNEEAVQRVFDLKARDGTKAMPVIVDSIDTMANYARVEGLAHFLADKLMPGQLNLIVPQAKPAPGHRPLAPNVGKDGTIAFRIPRHDFDLRLCKAFGKPVTATSANVSGHPAIYSSVEAIARFSPDVAVIIDAGDLPIRNFSTIFDLTASPFTINRQGMVSAKTLYAAVRQYYELQPQKEAGEPKKVKVK